MPPVTGHCLVPIHGHILTQDGGHDGEYGVVQLLALRSIAAQVIVYLLGGVPDNGCADMQDQDPSREVIVDLVPLLAKFLSLVELRPRLVIWLMSKGNRVGMVFGVESLVHLAVHLSALKNRAIKLLHGQTALNSQQKGDEHGLLYIDAGGPLIERGRAIYCILSMDVSGSMSGKAIMNFPSMLTAYNHMIKLVTWTEGATLLQSTGLHDSAVANEMTIPFSYGLMPQSMDRIEVDTAMISPLATSQCRYLCETLLRPHNICNIALMTLFLIPSRAVFGFSLSTLLLILLIFDFLLIHLRHQAHPHDAEEVPQVQISANRHHCEGVHGSEVEPTRGAVEADLIENILRDLEPARGSLRRAAVGHSLEVDYITELVAEVVRVPTSGYSSFLDRGLVQDPDRKCRDTIRLGTYDPLYGFVQAVGLFRCPVLVSVEERAQVSYEAQDALSQSYQAVTKISLKAVGMISKMRPNDLRDTNAPMSSPMRLSPADFGPHGQDIILWGPSDSNSTCPLAHDKHWTYRCSGLAWVCWARAWTCQC
ncbi:hypothetical protein CEK26_003695 [Fusarium fujikuroi]|nr:hypothetical protein CEK27_003687 [Fusarium fujikuroi]QGI88690.1 hypothetical protein CEK25_003646 [Fusarium fujikuroi]QGJ02251.1 hypothetical protein CEK26_003695 [Fusarium fujikuroi]